VASFLRGLILSNVVGDLLDINPNSAAKIRQRGGQKYDLLFPAQVMLDPF